MKKNILFKCFGWLMIVLFISACTISKPDNTNRTPIEQQRGTPTAEKTAEKTAVKTAEKQPVLTEASSADEDVTIYLVAIEDNGISGKKIGCDDSLVSVEVTADSNLESPWNAVETLLNVDADFVSETGFYNAFAQSDLELVQFEIKDNLALVYLEGEMMLGGVCDTPRIEEQIYATIYQSDLFDEVEFYINGELLEDYLSLKK